MIPTARAAARPKLSLSISAAQNTSRPTLSLKSPGPLPRTPISPSAASPSSARFSSLQVPSYGYVNSCSSKSILKKQSTAVAAGTVNKRIQFKCTPTVHCVTPIENPEEYYGTHTKMSREERRWMTEREDSSEFRVSSSVESLFPATVPGPNPGSTMQLAAQMQKSLWRTVRAERRTSGTKVKMRNVPVGKEGTQPDVACFLKIEACSLSLLKLLGENDSGTEPSLTANLSICTSDDTSVAIVEKNEATNAAKIHFLENVTADSNEYRGVHPIASLESHQENLAKLVDKALRHLPVALGNAEGHRSITLADGSQPRYKPDFVSATRGPGMRANLFVGLDTGKALSVAWQVPFMGVHHMQAHLLTPRLVSSLRQDQETSNHTSPSPPVTPEFPFLSILVSGGHSNLVKSSTLTDHKIMASTADIAIGESLDKSAREILPSSLLQSAKNTMYGKMLEEFAFPNGSADYADYRPPMNRGEELIKRETPWGWSLTTPFANTRNLQFSFSSIASAVKRIITQKENSGQKFSHEERVDMARESMRVCFEHLASRTIIALETLRQQKPEDEVKTVVVSGGVAANRFLMTVLRSFLDVRGFGHVDIVAPPPYLCTDNAAMIGWAGLEMFEAGWRTDLSARALRKWSLDPQADDGGVLGPSGWQKA
ncbi:peptidase M22 glycoprotease [Aspergillus oryzae]|uniref:N(6)-L-threonylcarbamoyladenine synthase n=3 Tax=Aspergillus subgen. Circumdati TaxID=2720871 RepID=A0A1S9DWG4_ASPOZ|nr:peptidase M22 glycoprotease [Aspergillus oryzae]